MRSETILVSRRNFTSDHNRSGRLVLDWRKWLLYGLESRQHRKQRTWRCRFDYETLSFFSHDRLIARELELARDADRLISPIPKNFDSPLYIHLINSQFGICQHMPNGALLSRLESQLGKSDAVRAYCDGG